MRIWTTPYELEIHGDRGILATYHYALKPALYVCRNQIAEDDGTRGYLIEYGRNGREVCRSYLYPSQ